jgi:hypothetical protein
LVFESPHITALHPTYGPVKASAVHYLEIEGTGFTCPDTNCTDLMVRFGEAPQYIYEKATWMNSTYVTCRVPKYTKPDVLRVELTLNDKDWTGDKKSYGFFDPYVLDVQPRLISTDGTTKIHIKGFGFVNSGETKALFNTTKYLYCGTDKSKCEKTATYIDKETLESETYQQINMNYDDGSNVLWSPIFVEASVYGEDFTDNKVDIYYY